MNKKEIFASKYIIFLQLLTDINENKINYLLIETHHKNENDYSFNHSLHFQGYVLSLYSIFQKHLCKLFSIQLKQCPSQYFLEKTIKFSDLISSKFKKQKIVDSLIEEKINTFTRGISDLETLCSSLGISQEGGFCEIKHEYEEFCCRRNIYAHGIDYITQEYLKVDQKINKSWLESEHLIENYDYVEHCTNLIYKMFFQIYFELNIANQKSIDLETLSILEQTIYTHFYKRKSWEVPRYFYKKLKNLQTNIKKQNFIIYKQMFYVNYLYCEKKLGNDISEKISKIAFKYEKDKFEIAKDALLDDYSKLYKDFLALQKKQVKLDLKITKNDLKEWPIFEDFRKTDLYSKLKKNNQLI